MAILALLACFHDDFIFGIKINKIKKNIERIDVEVAALTGNSRKQKWVKTNTCKSYEKSVTKQRWIIIIDAVVLHDHRWKFYGEKNVK